LLEGQEQSLGRLVELTERIDKRTEAQSRRVGG
jgi:hypothetical protein